jgi:hypothetical protein
MGNLAALLLGSVIDGKETEKLMLTWGLEAVAPSNQNMGDHSYEYRYKITSTFKHCVEGIDEAGKRNITQRVGP